MGDGLSPFDKYREARGLMEEGDYAEAEILLRQVIRAVPHYTDGWFTLAIVVFKLGRKVESAEICERLSEDLPNDVSVYDLWGKSLDGLGDPEYLRKVFSKVLSLDPTRNDVALRVAELDCELHKPKRGIRILRKQMEQHGESADLLTGLGECHIRVSQFKKAEEDFRKALRLDANYEAAHRGLESIGKRVRASDSDEEKGRLEDQGSLQVVDKSIDKPAMDDMHEMFRKGDVRGVIESIERFRAGGGRDFDLEILLAQAYNLVARYEDSIAVCESLLEQDPGRVEVHLLIGMLYCKVGDHTEGIESIRLALEIRPNYAEGYLQLALACRQAGRILEAEEAFRKALEFNTDDPES